MGGAGSCALETDYLTPMNVDELLLWYSVTAVLITLVALAIVILARALKRQPILPEELALSPLAWILG